MTNNTNISSTKNKAITIRNKTNKTNPSYEMRGKEGQSHGLVQTPGPQQGSSLLATIFYNQYKDLTYFCIIMSFPIFKKKKKKEKKEKEKKKKNKKNNNKRKKSSRRKKKNY
ncbi:hypothetical protein M8J75_005196 [Diaphorina citri]|nr:hypothetical protein M8J75_005196 [Diaphorina citri]KAI5743589.1 hypothetical protein M8J77_019911 [Diaphorina citri]